MKFSRNCCIVCMSDYSYDGFVCFYNMPDTPNEHHNNFILNHIPDFHITSPFILSDDTFESLRKLFADKMIKIDEVT